MRFEDPAYAREQYASEEGLAARAAVYVRSGPDARDVVVGVLRGLAPGRVLEVGCGWGELAERIAREVGPKVVAVAQSERMAELTRARGIQAIVGDVQALPFPDGSFDCAVAAWVLHHVPDLHGALSELARVLRQGGRLVAVTNGEENLRELWSLVGVDGPGLSFSSQNADGALLRHFTLVECREARGTVTFLDREAARRYVAVSPLRAHLAERLPACSWPLTASRRAAVFVAET